MAKAIPDGFHAITAALTVRHGAQAIDFYKRALGAEELMRIPGPDGKSLMHAELKIGDSIFMLSDEQPGMGCRAPASVGGPTSYLYVYVPDVDKAFRRAVEAGAKALLPPTGRLWGDPSRRAGGPPRHRGGRPTHEEDGPPQETATRREAGTPRVGRQGRCGAR